MRKTVKIISTTHVAHARQKQATAKPAFVFGDGLAKKTVSAKRDKREAFGFSSLDDARQKQIRIKKSPMHIF